MTTFDSRWQDRLTERQAAGLLRRRRILTSPQGVNVSVDGRTFRSFCSNDYLGLANDPRLKKAAVKAITDSGVGGGASHLVLGHHYEHEALECELAEFTGREKALVFSSGYMANMAVVAALANKTDGVFEDKLNHASLIDGGLLSGARFQRYLHNNAQSLSNYLIRFDEKNSREDAKKLVVTDGVFSMDGDVADLKSISTVCRHHDALLMVDDAHGLGVIGHQGRGSVSHTQLTVDEVPVLIGTFGKAFGTAGAFVAGSSLLIDYLMQFARPYIYTTSMPPAIAAATRESLRIIQGSDDKRAHLQTLIAYFQTELKFLGFDVLESNTAIQPIIIRSNEKLIRLSTFLEEQGFLVGAIRPPTVPENTARLRVTLSAEHQKNDVDALLASLKQAQHLGLL